MPTAEELIALPYAGSSPFANGMTGGDFRAQLQNHGHPFRWWKAWRVPSGATLPTGVVREANGRAYIEQTLAEGVHCLLYSTARDIAHPELGMVPKGHTAVSVMPDECTLAYLDRIALSNVVWVDRVFIKRGSGDTDALVNKSVASISSVMVDGSIVAGSKYEKATGGIKWLSDAPEEGQEYSVEYLYHPLFEFLGDEKGVVQIGKDGAFLPQRGLIRMIKPSGTETTY